MISKSNFTRTIATASLVSLLGLAAGCSTQHETLASAMEPHNVQQVTAAAGQTLAEGQFKEARAEFESFLVSNEDPTGQMLWTLAKACAQLGDSDAAIQYANLAAEAAAV